MDRSAGALEEEFVLAPGPGDDKTPKTKKKTLAQMREEGVWYPRWYWPSFAAPSTIWLVFLFLAPFYTMLSVAFGEVNAFQLPVPVWTPWQWDPTAFKAVVGKIFGTFGEEPRFQDAFIRTILYVAIASFVCVLIAYPVAYYVARFGGKRRTLYLTLLIAPFWVSYLMRMLAWTNLLQVDGYVNKVFGVIHKVLPFVPAAYPWLQGKHITVIFGLVYGYIPYMILPLYAGLDRINQSMLEASRDLGGDARKTFLKVTLPLSRQAMLAGVVIITLPMFGDYYTPYLMSNFSRTDMIGNIIDDKIYAPGGTRDAASLVIILMLMLIPFMLYYLRTSKKET